MRSNQHRTIDHKYVSSHTVINYITYLFNKRQKQPPEMFCKKIRSQKFCRIYRPQVSNFIQKETPTNVFSCNFCKNFWEQLFYRTNPDDCFCRGITKSFERISCKHSNCQFSSRKTAILGSPVGMKRTLSWAAWNYHLSCPSLRTSFT